MVVTISSTAANTNIAIYTESDRKIASIILAIILGAFILAAVSCAIALIWNHFRDYKTSNDLHDSLSAYYRSQAKTVA
jgi:hypothetical protein